MDLYEHFLQDIRRFSLLPYLAGQHVLVAVSGGADSLCLLHLLRRAAPALELALTVATLDHGLRGDAGRADADYVEALAREWSLPVYRGTEDVPSLVVRHRIGVEAAARLARYTFLAAAARRAGSSVIALGHQASDQAETILLHLIRGSGLGGLRGMQPSAALDASYLLPGSGPIGEITLIRPLLGISRAAIDRYCAEQGLHPREDATNIDQHFLRNRIRHEVLPLLEEINPGISRILVRMAGLIVDDYAKLEEIAEENWSSLLQEQTEQRIILDIERFRRASLSSGIRRLVLRQAFHRLSPAGQEAGFQTIENALTVALNGPTGASASLPGGVILRIAYNALILESGPPPPPSGPTMESDQVLPVRVPGVTALPSGEWAVVTRWLPPGADAAAFRQLPYTATLAIPPDATLTLRTRRPGDRIQPLGMEGRHQSLKKLLINLKIPSRRRDRLPLLLVNDTIAWIATDTESRIAAPYALTDQDAPVLLVQWVPQHL